MAEPARLLEEAKREDSLRVVEGDKAPDWKSPGERMARFLDLLESVKMEDKEQHESRRL